MGSGVRSARTTLGVILRVLTGASFLFSVAEAAPGPEPCARVQSAIDGEVARAPRASRLLALAPFLGPTTLPALLARARSAPAEERVAVYLAFGLTRHARALQLLQAAPERPGEGPGRALALLALGDGTGTATLSAVLARGATPERTRLARALARLPQTRPRMLLAGALEDPEPEVRATASLALYRAGWRSAERTLEALQALPGLPEKLRLRVVRALALGPGEADEDPAEEGSAQSRGDLPRQPRRLAALLLSADEATRAGALAAISTREALSVAALRRWIERAEKLRGAAVAAEGTMALALLGDEAALRALGGLDRAGQGRALAVLGAHLGGDGEPLAEPLREALGAVVSSWLDRAGMPAELERRALSALETLQPRAALVAARARLRREGGRGRALRIVGRYGDGADLGALLALAQEGPEGVRSRALVAAARICGR